MHLLRLSSRNAGIRALGSGGFWNVLLICCLPLLLNNALAQAPRSGNPILPGWYADPEAHIFQNQYWIYPTYWDYLEGATPRCVMAEHPSRGVAQKMSSLRKGVALPHIGRQSRKKQLTAEAPRTQSTRFTAE